MQAEVRWVQANDIPGWPEWQPEGMFDEFQWFTLSVGPLGDPGTDYFQVAVATPAGLRDRPRRGKFVGLVVERFEPAAVEQAIREFVGACQSHNWGGIVERLRARMLWEYAGP